MCERERKRVWGILISRCPSVCPPVTFWFLLFIFLNSLRNLIIFYIKVDIDEMLSLEKNKDLGANR